MRGGLFVTSYWLAGLVPSEDDRLSVRRMQLTSLAVTLSARGAPLRVEQHTRATLDARG